MDKKTEAKRFAQLVEKLETGQAQFEKANEAFQTKFSQNPVYAFEWADSVMSLAAKAQVYNRYLKFVKDVVAEPDNSENKLSLEEVLRRITKDATDHVLTHARSPKSSTSMCSNYMAQQTTAAHAELLDDLKWMCLTA